MRYAVVLIGGIVVGSSGTIVTLYLIARHVQRQVLEELTPRIGDQWECSLRRNT